MCWGVGYALSPRVRQEIIDFDPLLDARSVTGFCKELGIGVRSFYRIRRRAFQEGAGAALVARSRAPVAPARRWGPDTDERIRASRDRLAQAGTECGPLSVWWDLSAQGSVPAPSPSTVARRMRSMGLSRPTPGKRPRSAWKRFARARANELWQLDGIGWPLEGREVTIYQVHDDCTRVLVAITAQVGGETTQGAIAVLEQGFSQWGRPAAVLTDNGTAFNTHRRGWNNETEKWLAAQGIRPVSGRVAHPQTQGKVERAHQPVRLWLTSPSRCLATLEELNEALTAFQTWYNHERQHQGHGLGVTPVAAWLAVDKDHPADHPIDLETLPAAARSAHHLPTPPRDPAGAQHDQRTVAAGGSIHYRGKALYVGSAMEATTVNILAWPDLVELYDHQGTQFGSVPWPPPPTGRKGVNVTRPPHRLPGTTPTPQPLTHQPLPEVTTPRRARTHDTPVRQKP